MNVMAYQIPTIWLGVGILSGFILGFAVGIMYVLKKYFNIGDNLKQPPKLE